MVSSGTLLSHSTGLLMNSPCWKNCSSRKGKGKGKGITIAVHQEKQTDKRLKQHARDNEADASSILPPSAMHQ
ncbi:hypothetical protein L1887_05665 [Cichorium endivia]|nr:hypothetical protein L1887_05665 [Cichorium endivia]